MASHVVNGGIVVKALLVVGLWLAGWGAAGLTHRVLPDAGSAGQIVAATLAIWNPYVAERLLQGHWSLLVGYGCLPWVAATVVRLRAEVSAGPVCALVFWIALAGLTPTGLMLAATVALTCVVAPGGGRSRWSVAALSLGAALCAAAPWLTAAAVGGSLSSSQAVGVTAFAARAEPGLGVLGSLAGLGGIWNAQAVPGSRTTLFAVVATAVLLVVVAAGVVPAWRRAASRPLLILAAVAVLAPALMATGPGLAAIEAVMDAVPGLGVLRDGQKWVALAMPGYTLAAAAAVLVVRQVPRTAVAAVACAALIAVLPDLAWGVGGKLTSVRYPAGWSNAAEVINDDPGPVAVLPPDSMRLFDWAGTAPVLDPLPRWVRADVLSTGDLSIAGRVVPGEGIRAREVQDLLLDGAGRDALARAGVRWVVVENASRAEELDLPVAYRDGDIVVYRIGGRQPPAPHRGLLVAAHLVWLTVLIGGGVGIVVAAASRRRDHSVT